MNLFERYLAVWVGLCIIAGVVLGHFLPGVFQAVASLEIARVNIPVGVLVWVMIIPMLLRIDFGALHQVKAYWRGIGVTLLINWGRASITAIIISLRAGTRTGKRVLAMVHANQPMFSADEFFMADLLHRSAVF